MDKLMNHFFTKVLVACLLGSAVNLAFSQNDVAPATADLVISSGLEGGGYWNAGGRLQSVASGMGLTVDNRATMGSLANLKELLDRNSPVNLAFAQADALQYYLDENPDAAQAIETLENIGEECVFIISDSHGGIRTDKDMQEAPVMRLGIKTSNSGIWVTFDYMKGRPSSPKGGAWELAETYWRTLYSDDDAVFDTVLRIKGEEVEPTVTWGTSPEQGIPLSGLVPKPEDFSDPVKRAACQRALEYMGLEGGKPIAGTPVQRVFIGSCTNSRIEDLRAAAAVAKGNRVAYGVRAMVVPGSGLVRAQAEAEGLDLVFMEAGFEWREPGCSMCLGMNPDILSPGERCASTSNRNFEGRQGRGGRTHLMSPALAARAAINGKLG